jgi:hypothetical protein
MRLITFIVAMLAASAPARAQTWRLDGVDQTYASVFFQVIREKYSLIHAC